MKELQGKKLLILGGIRFMLEVAERAKELGVLVYVTDYVKDSPCKAIADKAFMVDATDVDAVAALCKKEKIDGIITGYVDMLLPYYAQICEKTGLPCYATKDQFEMITDKSATKTLCKQYSVPIPTEFTEEQIANKDIDYPVVVKPADSSGSRGVAICHDETELQEAIRIALGFSKKKKVIVEKYMTEGVVLMHYYIQDGEPVFIGMGDSYSSPVAEGRNPMNSLTVFPSKYTKRHLEEVDPQVKALIRGMGLKNGLFEIEAFLHNGLAHVGDIGYRLTGSRLQYLFREIFGLYSVDLMIHFALTGHMADFDIRSKVDPYMYGKHAFRVTITLEPGIVKQITGLEQLRNMPEVIGINMNAAEGDVFTEDDIGKFKQIACRIFLVADTESAIPNIANKVYDIIDFLDANGKSMKTQSNHYSEYLMGNNVPKER